MALYLITPLLLNSFTIFSINSTSFSGKEPSKRLFKAVFVIEKPALKINAATKSAIIGSKICIPVILISTNPNKTPKDEKISVRKCSASAKRAIEPDFLAVLKRNELTAKFATTANNIT